MVRPIKGWEEQDALTGWRRFYTKFKRAGKAAEAKRRYRRRERHKARVDIRGEW